MGFCIAALAAELSGCRSRSRTVESSADAVAAIEQSFLGRPLSVEERTRLDSVQVADGIDESEALTIGEMYFHAYLGACGSAERPVRSGEYWSSVVRAGVAGVALPTPIKVHATTGGVNGPDGPSFGELDAFRRAANARGD